MNQNLIFLDTETTGIANGRLVQLAYKDKKTETIFAEFYKPPVPIEIEAMAVHHITEKMISQKMPFENSPAHAILPELLSQSILVAHNAQFDIGVLERENIKVGSFICTYKVARSMYEYPQYKMQYLRYLWGIDDETANAHDAKGDIAILEKVFEHMMDDYITANGISAKEAIEAFIKISKNPLLLKKITFGKYDGKTFQEVKNADPDYFNWMATLKDKDEDFIYTMNYYKAS